MSFITRTDGQAGIPAENAHSTREDICHTAVWDMKPAVEQVARTANRFTMY